MRQKPDELKIYDQWVCWLLRHREGEPKPAKIPINPNTGHEAKSNDKNTWGAYQQAQQYADEHKDTIKDVGFEFSKDDPYCFIDFDNCITNGETAPHIKEWIEKFKSYTENSQSKKGNHIIIRGVKPGTRCRGSKTPGFEDVEIYDQDRFCAFTGDVLPGYEKIRSCQKELNEFYNLLFPPEPPQQTTAPPTDKINIDDKEILNIMFNSKNGDKIKRLWEGDTSQHNNDESKADLALCAHLAFYTQGDRNRIEQLFRQSGLNRKKWTDRAEYRERTIDEALRGMTKFYTPGGRKTEKKNKKDDEKEKTKITSKIIQEGKLWEQIYDPITNTSKYLHYDIYTAEVKTVDDITINGIKHLPINDALLERQAVILPTGIEEYYTTEILIEEIRTYIKKYLDITDEHLQKATWYVLLTWIYDNLHTIPYLRALGDYGSGKTRYEDVIGGISYKPTFVGGSVRSAPIYRVIDLWRGTAIFDEFTLKESDEAQDIIQILNCGYQRGKPVLRCKDGNYSEVECFDPFCPKILSQRKGFKDLATESRCITEIIRETGRKDIPIDLGETFYKERNTLQNKLLLWRFRNWQIIKPDEEKIIDFGNVQPRIKQTFLPFTILFLKDEKELQKFIATVKKYNAEQVEESSTSTYGLIVNIFLKKKTDGGDVVTAKDIRNELVTEHHFDEKTSANTVGRYLKPLGFTNKLIKSIDGKVSRSILVDERTLSRLVAKYVLPEDQEKLPDLKTICTNPQTTLGGGENE